MPKKKKKYYANPKIDRLDNLLEAKLVSSDDTIKFRCTRCGSCCRRVKDGVVLESLDIYRLAKLFRQSINPDYGTDDIILEYTHIAMLANGLYPIFLLNTIGENDSCVFLKNGRCSIQEAKPRACKLYPFSATPNDTRDGYDYFIVSQKPHHFKGTSVRVGDWIDENFTAEERDFVLLDVKFALEQAQILRSLHHAGIDQDTVLTQLLLFKYCLYDLDEPFIPQFQRNNELLTKNLQKFLLT
jgi:Fe-S-cluster containining protein